MVAAFFLTVMGVCTVIPLSLGNNPYARTPRRLVFAIFVALTYSMYVPITACLIATVREALLANIIVCPESHSSSFRRTWRDQKSPTTQVKSELTLSSLEHIYTSQCWQACYLLRITLLVL
jgi:hypothetical protein